MYYGSGTVDRIASGQQARQMLLNAVRCVFTHQVAALFCVKSWNYNVISEKSDSVNRCIFTSRTIRYQQFCRISSRSDI